MNPRILNMTDPKIGLKQFRDGQYYCEVPVECVRPDQIITRIAKYEDLFALSSVVEAYRSWIKDSCGHLNIVYLIGARTDHKFSKVGSFDLKPVCDFINRIGFDSVSVLEPHSDVTLALLNNSYGVSHEWWRWEKEFDLVVTPDAGAYKRVMHDSHMFNLPVVSAVKYRDSNGEPTISFTSTDMAGKRCLIVDDLADGARSFTGLAGLLYANGATSVGLSVAHGLFTYGFEPLVKAGIETIVTTNSYREFVVPENCPINFKVTEVI